METEIGKIGVAKAKRGRKERGSRKEVRRERRKEKEKTKERKKNGSEKSSRRVGDLG